MGKHGRHRSWRQKSPYPKTKRVSMGDSILLTIVLLIVLLIQYPGLIIIFALGGWALYALLKPTE